MASPIYGQVTTTGSAQQLDPTDKAANAVVFILKAPALNAASILLGDANVTPSTGYAFDGGEQIVYERLQQQGAGVFYTTRVKDVWVWIPTAGDRLTWLAFL